MLESECSRTPECWKYVERREEPTESTLGPNMVRESIALSPEVQNKYL